MLEGESAVFHMSECGAGSEQQPQLGEAELHAAPRAEALGTLAAFHVGSVRLLSPSRFLSADGDARLPGFWSVDATDDEDVPTAGLDVGSGLGWESSTWGERRPRRPLG